MSAAKTLQWTFRRDLSGRVYFAVAAPFAQTKKNSSKKLLWHVHLLRFYCPHKWNFVMLIKLAGFWGGSMTLVNFNVRRWVGRCPMFSPSFPATKPKRFPFCRLRSKTHPPSLSSLLSRAPTTRHSDNGLTEMWLNPFFSSYFFSEPAIWGIPGKNTRDCWPIRNVKKTICFARIFTVSEKGFSWLGSGCCLAHFICEFDVLLWTDIVSLSSKSSLLSPTIAHKTWQKPEEKKGQVGRLPSYSHPETGDDCKTAIGRNFYWLANHIYCFLFANSIYSPIFLFWSIASHGLLYFSPYSLGQWPGKDENIIHAIFYG